MKRILILAFCIAGLTGCKKVIEKQEQNAIVSAMTNGQWVITSFIRNGQDLTADFSAYKFQYHSNNTVDAVRNGSVDHTGTWEGDINTMSISANFSNAIDPISLLNGTWNVTDNSWTYVKASMTTGMEVRVLRLDKQ